MSLGLIICVLLAAALHAGWNVVVKSAPDQRAETILVAIAAAMIAAFALPFIPAPGSAAWPYLAASVLIQFVYFQLLGLVYRSAELSYAYPLMRGSAPLFTALLAAIVIGEHLGPGSWAGVLLLSSGVLILGADSWRSGRFGWSVTGFGLLNAFVIAMYTIVDGIGVRISGAPWSYIGWLFFLNAAPLLLNEFSRAPRRLYEYAVGRWHTALFCGLCMTASYGVALWAMTRAPVALVASLRETSVLFATVFAALFLKERFGVLRYVAAGLVAAGAIVMKVW